MSKQPTAPRDLLARERMTRALDMRKSGATLEAISNACGYGSRSSAHKAIRRALAELPVENATELRQVECLRLDELLVSYWQRAKKDVAVAYLVLKIVDQRARLLGLNIESEEVEKPMIVIRSEEHTSELQSPDHLVCRLLLEKKKTEKIVYVRMLHIAGE